MKKNKLYFLIFTFITALLTIQSCKKASNTTSKTTYEANVKPLWASKCASCHETGQAYATVIKSDYNSLKSKIDLILTRVKLDPSASGFMPKGGSKLSEADIAIFEKWISDGLLEK